MKDQPKVFKILVGSGILALCLIIYLPGLDYSFSHLDDYQQVIQNQAVKNLDVVGLFSQSSVGMYQPLSSLFFSLIYRGFGASSAPFHLLSLCFHLVNTFLVYRFLRQIDIQVYPGLLLTAIFTLHPMQVEAVAWISAFSTLCSVFFILLGLLFYLKAKKDEKAWASYACFFAFLLACFSKSLAVIFPLFLILIDFYHFKKRSWRIIYHKWPYFLLSLAFGILTISFRETAGHLSDLSADFSVLDRVFLVSYNLFFYLFKFALPINLSAFYPFPKADGSFLDLPFYLSFLALLITGYAFYRFPIRSKVKMGLGIYLIGLILLIQIIPLGNQLNCDRYLYLSMIGLLVALSRILEKVMVKKWRLIFILIPCALAFQSHQRAKVWQSDEILWKDVLSQFPKVAQAYNNLGSLALEQRNNSQAINYLNQAIEYKPYYSDAYSNRGSAYLNLGKPELAILDLNKAIQLKEHPDAYFNRANAQAALKKYPEAVADYSRSLNLQKRADAYTNRAFIYAQIGDPEKALSDLGKAIQLDSQYAQAYYLRALIYRSLGNQNPACEDLAMAAKLKHPKARLLAQEICNP